MLLREFVIAMPTNVEPIFTNRKAHYRSINLKKPLDEIGHVECLALRNISADRWLEQIDAGVDEKRHLWFFGDATNS